jgi:hypothetical protein
LGWHCVSGVWLASAAALLGEALALRAMLGGASLMAAAWHVGACVVAGMVAGLGGCERRERCYRGLVACALCVCLPGTGLIGLLCVLLPIWRRRARPEPSPIAPCEPVEPRDVCLESAALAELMLHARARSLEQSMRRLRALRSLPLVAALPHWHAALRQPDDELRLLAHALVAQGERRLQDKVERAHARLRAASSQAERWSALRGLAFAYWEIACSERMPAESLEHPLAESSARAQAALAIHPEAQLCLLLARICLRQTDGARASYWLQRAGCLGVSSASRALLHAEAAFLQRRFEQVPHWLRQVSEHELHARRLARARAFWLHELRNWRERDPSSEQ